MRSMFSRTSVIFLAIALVVIMAGCQSTAVRSAKIYMQQNDPENAKLVLEEGSKVTPQDAELWYILGKVYVDLEDYVKMNEAFAKCQELTQSFDEDIKNTRYESWRVTYNAAVTPFNDKRFEDAIEMLKVAIQILPGDPETLKRMGLCYLQIDDFENAEANLKAGIEASETPDVSSMYNLLLIHWRQTDYEKVISSVDDILAVATEEMEAERKVDVIQKKALALQQLDKKDEAIAVWDLAIESDPTNPDFYYNKAILLHSMEKYDDAAIAYLKAIELNPEDQEARMNAARSLLASQKWETLIEVLEPMLFPTGEIVVHETEFMEMDPWLILRAAYENLGVSAKSDVVAQILIKIQKSTGE